MSLMILDRKPSYKVDDIVPLCQSIQMQPSGRHARSTVVVVLIAGFDGEYPVSCGPTLSESTLFSSPVSNSGPHYFVPKLAMTFKDIKQCWRLKIILIHLINNIKSYLLTSKLAQEFRQ